MGSIASNDSGDSPVYRSSKAALNMVMKGLSHELKGKGVTVASSSQLGQDRHGW